MESCRGNAERHQAEEDDEKGQAAEAHEAEGKRGKEQGCGTPSVRQQHPDPGRNEEPRSHCGNPAKNVLKYRMMSVLEVHKTEHKTDGPGDQKEAVPRSFVPTQTAMPTMFGPGRNWHKLTISPKSCSVIHRR